MFLDERVLEINPLKQGLNQIAPKKNAAASPSIRDKSIKTRIEAG